MAKKGQAVQLQAEINTDDEWDKFLQKDGLIIVDVYSDWCGPCQGMTANLKKIKLEYGGDLLHLAIAKSDSITPLERFRNKSEPTWMFISKGKMVNLTFGANAPRLARLIFEEIKKEQLATSGEKDREILWEVTEMAPEEQERYNKARDAELAAQAIEEAKKTKALRDRKIAECDNINNNLPGFGAVLISPCAKDLYQEVLNDLVQEAGLTTTQIEKIKVSSDILEELQFFCETKLSTKTVTDFTTSKIVSLAILFKRSSDNLPGDIDEVVLQMVYGNSRKPLGDERSPSRRLIEKLNPEETDDENILTGIWAPPDQYSKALALKLLFQNLSAPFKIPNNEPPPLYVAVGYDAFKTRDVMELSAKYPGMILSYGFFTSDIPPDAQLLAKTVDEFEARKIPTTYEEKIVIQLAKTSPAGFTAFAELGPSYMSSDVEAGEIDCNYFFPPGYNVREKEVTEVKKKSKRKKKHAAPANNSNQEEVVSVATSDLVKEQSELDHEEITEAESDEEKVESTCEEGDERLGADKATSPIEDQAIG